MNAQAHCAEPSSGPVDVRGSQNVPQPGGAGGTSAARNGSAPAGSAPSTAPTAAAPPPLSSLAQILLP